MSAKDRINQPNTMLSSLGFGFQESVIQVKGAVSATLTENGETRNVLERNNIYTLDGGILAAMLFSGLTRAPNVLAVGTGASGSSSSPDSPDARQRKLNTELTRKEFASTVFRDSTGAISAVPTNVLDFTTVFESGEAVGALNEMGIVSAINVSAINAPADNFPDRDTSTDLTSLDVLVNYLPFPVINKPSGATLAITWRLTF